MLQLEDVQDATLLDAVQALEQVDAELDKNGGEFTDALGALTEALDAKVDGKFEAIAKLVINKEAEAEMYRKHAKKLQAKCKAVDATVDRLRNYADMCMQQMKILRTGTSPGFARQLNPPKVVIKDKALIPRMYFTQEITEKLSLAAIKDTLSNPNGEVAGCELGRDRRLVLKV